jgi:hypothetical protein
MSGPDYSVGCIHISEEITNGNSFAGASCPTDVELNIDRLYIEIKECE